MFTAELFPTTIRSSAVGICSLMARIGGISAPQIAIALPKVIICSQLSGVLNSTHSLLQSIYKFGLSVCLSVCPSVCLYPINVETAEPIGPKFFVGSRVTPGKVYG